METIVRIISLPQSSRRVQFRDCAHDTDAPWKFFDGYASLASPLQYDSKLAIRHFGRELSAGEIGCYSSHYKLWEEFLRSKQEQMIVLEDDVIVDWGVINRLLRFDFATHQIDILKLFCTHAFSNDLCIPRFLSPHSHLLRVRGMTFGTQAYLVTRKGAEAFMRASSTISMPVDWVMSRYWRYKVPNYCLFPFPVLERYGVSAIGHAGREITAVDGSTRAYSIMRRLKDRAAREIFDRSSFRSNPCGDFEDVGPAFIDRIYDKP